MLFSSIINTTSNKAKLQQYTEPPVCWSEPDPYVVTWAHYLFTCLLRNSFTCCSCHKRRWTAYVSFIPELKNCIVGKITYSFLSWHERDLFLIFCCDVIFFSMQGFSWSCHSTCFWCFVCICLCNINVWWYQATCVCLFLGMPVSE